MKLHSQRIGRRGWLVMLVVGLLGLALPAGQTRAAPEARTIRVAGNGSNTTNCGGESNPCRDIQYAVDRAVSGDTILVAGGIYTYREFNACGFLDTRAILCFVDKNITIRGGYSTTNWTTPNLAANPTVLDGQGARRGVVLISYPGVAFLTMSGFTIQNCVAVGSDKNGPDDSLTRQGIGAGMWGQVSSVNLTDVVFKNNIARGVNSGYGDGGAGTGGGLGINSAAGTSTLTRVTFENNQALGGSGAVRGGVALGGGLFTYEARLVANDVRFINNQAVAGNSAGLGFYKGLHADALGGAASFQLRTDTTFNNVVVTNNKAVGGNAGAAGGSNGGNAFGGGVFVEGGAMALNNVLINANQAVGGLAFNGGGGYAGGMAAQNGDATLNRVRVLANKAVSGASQGGSARAAAAGGLNFNLEPGYTPIRTVSIVNSIIADNRIEYGGNTTLGAGGGVTIQAMAGTVSHTTIARNTLGPGIIHGQGLLIISSGGGAGIGANVQLRHSILAEHTGSAGAPALEVQGASTVTMTQNMFAGNTKDTNANGQPSQPGTINGMASSIIAASGGFASPGSPNFDYRLGAASAAINKATSSTLNLDYQNQARPFGAARDIGADEYSPVTDKLFIPLVTY